MIQSKCDTKKADISGTLFYYVKVKPMCMKYVQTFFIPGQVFVISYHKILFRRVVSATWKWVWDQRPTGLVACVMVLHRFLQRTLGGRAQAGRRFCTPIFHMWKEGPCVAPRKQQQTATTAHVVPSLAPRMPGSDSRREGEDASGVGSPCLVSAALNSEGPWAAANREPGVRGAQSMPPADGCSRQPAADSAWLHSAWCIYGPIKY